MARAFYLGPPGTFTHMAAKEALGHSFELAPASTIAGVFDGVAAGAAELGVVPIENSTEGSVGLTLDCLLGSTLKIQEERVLDVVQCLVARHRQLERFARVASHPQALGQCRRWLAAQLPHAEPMPVASTAAAARLAADDESLAAVASRLAAELFDLEVVAEAIQDQSPNVTRFVIVGRGEPAPSGRDRTSVVFSLPHTRGALRSALETFDRAGLNLTRIESRPLPGRLWEYLFFVDFEGHARDPAAAAALSELARSAGELRVLGSYPRAF
jgi:chorismate mutase/prephenate dehydratase